MLARSSCVSDHAELTPWAAGAMMAQ